MTACTGVSVQESNAEKLFLEAGMKPLVLTTSTFQLAGALRMDQPGKPLTLYIEGDGRAWLTRHRPSLNPTPVNPVALRLAVQDGNANVGYLARPCQYTDQGPQSLCAIPYWTDKRFAPEVITATHEAINQMMEKAGAPALHLVGYSGGGAVAVLAAARRSDVSSLRSVAGYMDPTALNQARGFSPLSGSLDPVEAAPKLQAVPQIHYVGSRDKKIPGWVTRNFGKALGAQHCLAIRTIDAGHVEGWVQAWKQLWAERPVCKPPPASPAKPRP